ncbi:MAG: hypothetical protein ACM3OG_02860 [Actinomycetota bacterium]
MKLLTGHEIVHRLLEAFGRHPVTDVPAEALCHNLQIPFEGYSSVDEQDRILILDPKRISSSSPSPTIEEMLEYLCHAPREDAQWISPCLKNS